MLELLGLLAAGAATAAGYLQTRGFVSRRLRFVDAVQKPGAPVLAGVGAAAAATPVVWLLPLVGGGTAVLFGVGVAAGVAAGAKRIRRGQRLLP